MSDYFYKESCPDYFCKDFSIEEYQNQIDTLNRPKRLKYLYVDSDGIKKVGIPEKIWESVRGFFGFENRTSVKRLNSKVLKLLYYGQVHGYMNDNAIQECIKKFKQTYESKKLKISQKIKLIVQELLDSIQEKRPCNLNKIRRSMIMYHKKHEEKLRPSLWYQWNQRPCIRPCTTKNFGSTHLQIADLLDNEQALRHFEWAHKIHNEKRQFQFSLQNKLKRCVSVGWYEFSNLQKQKIQKIFRGLSDLAYANQRYQNLEKINRFCLRYFPYVKEFQSFLCEALIRQSKFDEANTYVHALETKSKDLEAKLDHLMPEETEVQTKIQNNLCKVYEELGDFYSHDKTTYLILRKQADFNKASQYFMKALQLDGNDKELEAKAFDSLISMVIKENNNFLNRFKSLLGYHNETLDDCVEKATKYISHLSVDEFIKFIKTLQELKKYDASVQFFDFALKKFPSEMKENNFKLDADTHYQYGLQLKNDKKAKEAYEQFDRAFDLDTNHRGNKNQLYYLAKDLGDLDLKEKKYPSALRYFEKAYKCNSTDKEVKEKIRDISVYFAELYLAKCELKNSKLIKEEFENKFIKHKEEHKEDLKLAIQWYDKAIEVDPDNARLHFDKAGVLIFFDIDVDKCFEEYHLAVKLPCKNPFYLLRLASTYSIKKHNDGKYKEYRDKALNCATEGIGLRYIHYEDERFEKNKIYNINPHSENYF